MRCFVYILFDCFYILFLIENEIKFWLNKNISNNKMTNFNWISVEFFMAYSGQSIGFLILRFEKTIA